MLVELFPEGVFRAITHRAAFAAVLAFLGSMFLMPAFLAWLRRRRIGERVEKGDAPQLDQALRSKAREFHLDVEFTCQDDVSVVFGASGSGKSATLRAIAGLERPDSGRIVVDGRMLFDSQRGIDVPARMRSVA